MNIMTWLAALALISVLLYVMIEVKDWIDGSDNQ